MGISVAPGGLSVYVTVVFGVDDPPQLCHRLLFETHTAAPGTREVGWKYGHPRSLLQLPQSPTAGCVQLLLIHVKAASHPQGAHKVGGGWDNQCQGVGCSYRWTDSHNLPGGASEKPHWLETHHQHSKKFM